MIRPALVLKLHPGLNLMLVLLLLLMPPLLMH
jgi:hypothetical protein